VPVSSRRSSSQVCPTTTNCDASRPDGRRPGGTRSPCRFRWRRPRRCRAVRPAHRGINPLRLRVVLPWRHDAGETWEIVPQPGRDIAARLRDALRRALSGDSDIRCTVGNLASRDSPMRHNRSVVQQNHFEDHHAGVDDVCRNLGAQAKQEGAPRSAVDRTGRPTSQSV
jgi:hypothetical protein